LKGARCYIGGCGFGADGLGVHGNLKAAGGFAGDWKNDGLAFKSITASLNMKERRRILMH